MTMIAPTLLQFVGMVGLVILLAGSLHARQWLGVVAAVACLLSVVSADVLVLPTHWLWLSTAGGFVFVVTGLVYLITQLQHRWPLHN